MSESGLIATVIIAFLTVLLVIVVGGIHAQHLEGQKAIACVESGGEWIGDDCIRR